MFTKRFTQTLSLLLAAGAAASITACGRQNALQAGLPALNHQPRFQTTVKTGPQPNPRLRAKSTGFKSDAGLAAASERVKELLFNQMDRNKDGALQQYECVFGIELFVKVDEDRNGVLSRAEVLGSNAFAEHFYIQPDQLRRQAQSAFGYADSNKDNLVGKVELLNQLMPYTSLPDCVPGIPCTIPSHPYPSPPISEGELRELKVQILKMFNLGDKNFDTYLDFSEYEDMYTFSMISESEVPYPAPSSLPGQPAEPSPIPTATALPEYRR